MPALPVLRPSVLLAAALIGLACDGGANVIGPSNELEATSAVDQFQFQVSNLSRVTDTRRYDWQNTGAQATVDVSGAVSGGSAVLTIRDADGVAVYEADLADGRDGVTTTGVAGTWTIEVTLFDASGTVNFRVQKAT